MQPTAKSTRCKLTERPRFRFFFMQRSLLALRILRIHFARIGKVSGGKTHQQDRPGRNQRQKQKRTAQPPADRDGGPHATAAIGAGSFLCSCLLYTSPSP